MKTKVNPFFCPMDKKMISPHIDWGIGKCPGLCTIIFKTSTWYLKFMLYYAVIKICLGYLIKKIMFMPKLCSGRIISIIHIRNIMFNVILL